MFQSLSTSTAAAIVCAASFLAVGSTSPARAATCTVIPTDTCKPNIVYDTNGDPTSNSAPHGFNQTLNGTPLLVSLNGSGAATDGPTPGDYSKAFTFTGTTSGTWSFDPTKVTGLGTNPVLFPTLLLVNAASQWYYTSVANAISGSWSVSPITNPGGTPGVSHLAIFDTGTPPSAVPLPGALLLFGSVLAGAGGVAAARRRREKNLSGAIAAA